MRIPIPYIVFTYYYFFFNLLVNIWEFIVTIRDVLNRASLVRLYEEIIHEPVDYLSVQADETYCTILNLIWVSGDRAIK